VTLQDQLKALATCRVNPLSSRACELGTRGCVTVHDSGTVVDFGGGHVGTVDADGNVRSPWSETPVGKLRDPGEVHYADARYRCKACGSAELEPHGMGSEIFRHSCRTCGADPA
jgi:hypothetical protein